MTVETWAAWIASGKRQRAGGHDVFVRVEGSGPTLFFLHGFPTSSFDYAPVIDRLRRKYRCVCFDFVGLGASEKPDIHYDFDLQVGVASDVASAEGIERAVVVAHDYGVTVGQELLARDGEGRAPFDLAGVLFLNGGLSARLVHPIFTQRLLAGPLGPVLARHLLGRGLFERSMKRIVKRMDRFDVDEHWRAVSSDHGVLRMPAIIGYMEERRRRAARWDAALREARPPLAFVWGLDDPISGGHLLDWVASTAPAAEIVRLPGIGHYPQLEAAEEVSAAIERFAARHLCGPVPLSEATQPRR